MSCAAMSASDPYCGFASPVLSAFGNTGTTTSSTATLNEFLPLLVAACPAINVTTIPTLFCMGSFGPCYGTSWTLPANPTNLTESAAFFNNIKFADLLSAFTAANAKPPCLAACQEMVKPLLTCTVLDAIGVQSTSDPCAGLPTTGCVDLPGDKNGDTITWTKPSTASTSAAASTNTQTAAATSTGAATSTAMQIGSGLATRGTPFAAVVIGIVVAVGAL
ncbi:hypothetical protein HDU83_003166 [Entophlyctis luteolus]|nr:hypothetical protein HDU83_003166 [Entophlyctis luteolus]